jgi:hypothetical protein
VLEGSCACGSIRYEIRGELLSPVSYCHCWQCRKQSGSSFGTTAGVEAAAFRVVSGQELLASWPSSPGTHRFFARCCGSPIYKTVESSPDVVRLRLGTLDSDPGRGVERHIFLTSKVPWLEIEDDLPQHPGGARFGERS